MFFIRMQCNRIRAGPRIEKNIEVRGLKKREKFVQKKNRNR